MRNWINTALLILCSTQAGCDFSKPPPLETFVSKTGQPVIMLKQGSFDKLSTDSCNPDTIRRWDGYIICDRIEPANVKNKNSDSSPRVSSDAGAENSNN